MTRQEFVRDNPGCTECTVCGCAFVEYKVVETMTGGGVSVPMLPGPEKGVCPACREDEALVGALRRKLERRWRR